MNIIFSPIDHHHHFCNDFFQGFAIRPGSGIELISGVIKDELVEKLKDSILMGPNNHVLEVGQGHVLRDHHWMCGCGMIFIYQGIQNSIALNI
jgi:hypothetical protein